MSQRRASEQLLACRRAVSASIEALPPGSEVIVACSGGPDSLALVGAAAWSAPRAGHRLSAVIVDHGLQSGSAQVAAEASQTCALLGVPATVVRVEVGTIGGPEAAARAARYSALEEEADRVGASAVLLGHTLEDQAETVLLRLARGSGARSLSAMAASSGRWHRPLLGLSRATVRAAAQELLEPLGRSPWSDPHNADPSFARVRVRGLLEELRAALGDGAVAGLARSAELLRDDANALEDLARQATVAHVVASDGMWSAECSQLQTLPTAIRSRVIRSMMIDAGVPADDAGLDAVRAVDALVSDWHGQGAVSLPGRVRALRSCGRLCVHASSPGQE